jgi:serine/threonine protein kinase
VDPTELDRVPPPDARADGPAGRPTSPPPAAIAADPADGPSGFRTWHPVGAGGMGLVALATHPRWPGRWLALKRMAEGYRASPSLRARFVQESALVLRVHHPHLVRGVDHGTDEDGPWLAMEYIPGPPPPPIGWPNGLPDPPLSLQRRTDDRTRLTAEWAIDLGLKLAGAVATLHARGIVHGDIKPHNVLCDPTGEPILIDFGLARPVRPSGVEARSVRAATVHYAAPELQTDPDTADPRADVYSLAGTLVYALTGRLPAFCPADQIPEQVRDVLTRATSRDPADRPVGVMAFATALADCRTGRPAAPAPSPATPGVGGLIVRRRPAVAPPGPSGMRIRRRPGTPESDR